MKSTSKNKENYLTYLNKFNFSSIYNIRYKILMFVIEKETYRYLYNGKQIE